jgi:hypothetical protein
VKLAVGRLPDEAADESADDRSSDAKGGGKEKAQLICARHDCACYQTHDETDDNGPDDPDDAHGTFSSLVI